MEVGWDEFGWFYIFLKKILKILIINERHVQKYIYFMI